MHFKDVKGKECPPGRDIGVTITTDGCEWVANEEIDEILHFATFSMNSDESKLVMEWRLRPNEANRLAGASIDPTKYRVIEKEMHIKVHYDDESSLQLCDPIVIPFRLKPGKVKNIQCIDRGLENLSLTDGDHIPNTLLACLDGWGNRTAPETGDKWDLIMSYDGCFEGPQMFPISTNGEIQLYGIVTSCMDYLPSEGRLYTIKGTLRRGEGEEQIETRYGRNRDEMYFIFD